MDGERYSEPVNDPLDREIESLLVSDPSPAFLARVRTRVAQEPEPRQWRAPWMLALSGVVAALVVAVIAWPAREVLPSSDAPEEPSRIVETAVVPTQPPMSSAPVVRERPAVVPAAASAVQRDRAIDIDLPEVVIADNEVKTFAALVASIRHSRFDVTVPAEPNPDTPLEIKELAPVEPLEIEPIVRVAALQAEGERP
jgi:hypothetical protein